MKIVHRWVCCVCLALAICLAGCCAPEPVSLPSTAPLAAAEVPTRIPSPTAIPSATPTLEVPTDTLVPSPTSPTGTPHLGRFGTVRITEQPVVGVYWSADGQSVIYATSGERSGTVGKWWRYQVLADERYPIEPPFDLNPEIWVQLEASYVDDAFVWFGGGISPSGARVVYNRLPPGYNHTPAPDDFPLPPYEAWTAQSSGSDTTRLQSCPYITQAIWLDRERKILLVCSYEGGGGISIVSVDGVSPPSDPLGGLTVSHWVTLSPDETKLAFPDAFGTLRIAFLDSGEIRQVAQWGYMPNWSSDSRRLYYQHAVEFTDRLADIRVYDLDTGTDTLLMPSPLHASGDTVSIPVGTFAVSPLENSAVFRNGGLWLVRWSA
jgi:hypothetical protein